jgi:putative addiction module component (TIGR02574 family)
MPDIMASLANLTPAEKLQLIGKLWDDLSASPTETPLTDWQREELARRKENLRSNPSSALTWEEIISRIKQKHAD